jgi:hypothetical protein
VFVAADDTGRYPVLVTTLNGRSSPRHVTAKGASRAYFAAGGYVFFVSADTGPKFIYRVREDGSELQKIVNTSSAFSVSPDGKWVVTQGSGDMAMAIMVNPVDGGSPTLICGTCVGGPQMVERSGAPCVSWSPDGKFFYLYFREFIYAIPLRPGQMLPPIPAAGFRSKNDVAALPGARLIAEQEAFPGPNPSIYAFIKLATHRNIYRVSVP